MHTSGTTGLPKLVPLTHQQLITAVVFMKLEVPEAVPGARHLSALPLFHVAGLANLSYTLFTGGHLHLLAGFDPAGFVDELVRRRIQLTQLVPTLIHAVTQEVSSRAEPPDLSQLTEIVYGASPIRPDLLERAVAVLGCRFRQNYASSETGPLPITSLPPEDHDPARGRLGTAGRPSLGWEVRLGERGEIQVRGAAPLPGYWNDPEATARSLTADGFYRTGDVGTIGADGYLTIVDRLSDLVITGGENVYPAEVEAVLAAHPAVADVAVIGVPDERWGETVHAVVAAGSRGDPPAPEAADRNGDASPGSTRAPWSAGRASGWPGSSARPASRSSPNCRATRPARCCGPRCASRSGPAATASSHDGARPGPASQYRPARKGHPQGPPDRRGLPRGGPARVRPRRLPQRQDQRHRRGGRPVGRVLLQLLRHQGGPAHRAGRGVPRRSLPAGRPAVPGRRCPARRRCARPWPASGAPTPNGAAS